MNRVELKEWAKQKISGNIGNIFIGIGIIFAISLLFSFGVGIVQIIFGETSFITFIVSLVVEFLLVPLQIGLNGYMMGFVQNDTFNRDAIFAPYDDTFKIIGASILMSFVIMIGFIFFIIPGIYLAFSYALVPYLLVTNKNLSITETLELSRKMMNGHKLDLFVLGISFLGWMLLVPCTFGIILIWLYPYMMTATTKFFVDIIDSYNE
ncbi:MAG: DUF975 family protein [Tenericutes bacterium]|nr:DUF975 family protein [Mycoplasmatota bacterium]